MAAQTLSSFSESRWNYDVFLSFRGKDTRKNFTDHLYSALKQVGIYTFRDDDKLSRGEHISTELLKAIQGSRVSVVVFSKSYASSSWCLDELVEILRCKNTIGQTLLPIFYDVDPSEVRYQTGTFAEAFVKHENRFQAKIERVHKWRAALTEAASYSGWDLQNGFESRFIQKIVEEILRKVNPAYLHVAKYPVRIDSRVKEIKNLLNLGISDVRNVGIYGMGGIGKTTIAKAVYNEILHEFEGSSFLFNIKKTSEQSNGLIHLQEQLLYDILKIKDWKIGSVDEGINLITKRFYHKKVLVVLDDVDHLKQLHSLVGNFKLFGKGSTLIVTTRDKHVLTELRVQEKYKVEEMNHEESLQLFHWHAFKMTDPAKDFKKLSLDVVDYVGRLPLAAEVLGSYLSGRSIIEWKSALEKLQKIPHKEIQKILRISFDSLEDYTVKDTFLDIACFFIGTNKEYVCNILNGCGFFTDIGISILIDRSLLIVNERNELRMHDLIRDMGREIVREIARMDPGKYSRLWCHNDVLHVLNKHLGSKAIEGLNLNLPALEDVKLKTEAFANMKNLRLLQIDGANLVGSYEHLSKELRWLRWHKCPLEFLPPNFHLENVVILDMQHSNVKQVWKEIKILDKLKVLNLKGSKCLTRSPNFLQLPHLEILILEGCTSLIEVHESIGHLKKLVLLNLQGCKNLKNLPESILNLESLETLNLSECIKIDKLPNQLENMVALEELLANGIAIKQLPSFGLLKNLKTLSLSGCKGQSSRSWMSRFVSWISQKLTKPIYLLPTSVSGLYSLRQLNLSGCNLFEDEIPFDLESLPSLQELDLSRNNFRTLPRCISRLPQLNKLYVDECASLESILELPTSLGSLSARGCSTLQRLPDGPNQGSLWAHFYMESCESLAYDIRKSLLQYMSKFREYGGIALPGSEVPNWFSHRRFGSSISFHIPSLPKAQIKGLLFCAGFAPKQETPHEETPNITVYINSIHWNQFSFGDQLLTDYSSCRVYIAHSTIEGEIASGMEIKMKCEGGKYFEVKECGIHVILDDDPNAMDEYMDSVTLKRGRDHHNEARPSNDWFSDDQLNCPKRLKMKDLDSDQLQE